jgi:hypothetical protein
VCSFVVLGAVASVGAIKVVFLLFALLENTCEGRGYAYLRIISLEMQNAFAFA